MHTRAARLVVGLLFASLAAAQQDILTLYFLRTPDGAGGFTVEQVDGVPVEGQTVTLDPIHITCVGSSTSQEWDVFRIVQTAAGELEAHKTTMGATDSRTLSVETPTPPGGGTPENPWVLSGIAYQLNGGLIGVAAGSPEEAANQVAQALTLGWPPSEQCATVRVRAIWIREYDRSDQTPAAWDVATHVRPVSVQVTVGVGPLSAP